VGRHPVSYISWHPSGRNKIHSNFTVLSCIYYVTISLSLFILFPWTDTTCSLIFRFSIWLLWGYTLFHLYHCILQVEINTIQFYSLVMYLLCENPLHLFLLCSIELVLIMIWYLIFSYQCCGGNTLIHLFHCILQVEIKCNPILQCCHVFTM